MLELAKHFGYKKFIIIIPSVPIREGTKTNLQDTKAYFKSVYANERQKEIQTHVYEAGNTSEVTQFINKTRLSVKATNTWCRRCIQRKKYPENPKISCFLKR